MSLINEALKKAQRQRAEVPLGPVDAPGGPVQKRGAPMRAQTMILLTAAAVALIVCSVVVTVYLLNRRPTEPTRAIAVATPKTPAIDPNAPSPVIIAPVLPKPAPPEAAPVIAAAEPPPAPAAATPIRPAPIPAAPASVVPANSRITAPPNPQILAFVDAIKVAGIRSSGNGSKVLMNDRVFRVNEIVERTLGVKLVKVESDALTFEDGNGVIYTKNF